MATSLSSRKEKAMSDCNRKSAQFNAILVALRVGAMVLLSAFVGVPNESQLRARIQAVDLDRKGS